MLKLQKRGLSDVVVTVLIILIAIGAISIVWGYLSTTISSAGSEITTACTTLDLQPLSCNVDTANAYVRFSRNAGTATLTNVSLIFEMEDSDKVIEAISVPNVLETKIQTVTLAQLGGTPKKFSVAGTIQGESGKKKVCSETYKISCGTETIVGSPGGSGAPTCTSFTYSAWTPEPCNSGQQQTRTVLTSSPQGCTGGNPVTSQMCNAPTCTSFTYSAWSPDPCTFGQQQTRTVLTSSPQGCTGGNPVTSQTCTQTYTQGLNVRVFTGNWGDTHPSNHQQLVALFGSPYTLAYSGTVTGSTHINWGDSPWPGINDNYVSEYTGYIYISTPGVYSFGINGDDAVEIEIDGVVRSYWYNGHGTCTPTDSFSSSMCYSQGQRTTEEINSGQGISLTAGYHQFTFRHEEGLGGDTAFALWKRPGDSIYTIIPPAAYFR